MARRILKTNWNRRQLDDTNENFKELYEGFVRTSSDVLEGKKYVDKEVSKMDKKVVDAVQTSKENSDNAIIVANEAKNLNTATFEEINDIKDIAVKSENKSNDAKNIAQTSDNKVEDVKRRLDNILSEGDSNAEVVDARTPRDLKSFSTLGERLHDNDLNINRLVAATNLKRKHTFIGHQGLKSVAPPNSKIAFKLAAEMGLDGIETDVKVTKDGFFVLYHDDDLSTLTNGTGRINDVTYAYIKTLHYIDNKDVANYKEFPKTPIATLDDYLEVAYENNLIITPEIQIYDREKIKEVIDRIKYYKLDSNCIYTVNRGNYHIIRTYDKFGLRNLTPSWGKTTKDDIDFCVKNGIEYVGMAVSDGKLDKGWLDKELVEYAKSKGLRITMYIVNTTGMLKNCIENGADVITTDVGGGIYAK